MVITLCAESAGRTLRIGWISLQPDGSISVGLNDRTLIVREFKDQNLIWNVFNRITAEYFVPSDPTASRSVAQPHLTFHPPHWFHLTGGPKKKLFEGIADIALSVRQQGTVPWVRFISKPIAELKEAKGQRASGAERSIAIPVSSLTKSVRLSLDFVEPQDVSLGPEDGFAEWVDHGPYRLRICAGELPGSRATLGWFHHS